MVIKQWPDSIRVLHLFNQIFLKSFAPCIWISAWYLMPPHFCFQALETEWDKPCFSWVLLKGLWLWSWCQFAPVGWFQFFQRRMSNRLVKKHVLIWGISLCSWKFVGRNNYSSQQCIYIYICIHIYIYLYMYTLKHVPWPPYHPWGWCIYLHEWWICMEKTVGKYTGRPMDSMGDVFFPPQCFSDFQSFHQSSPKVLLRDALSKEFQGPSWQSQLGREGSQAIVRYLSKGILTKDIGLYL